ncbi:MAG TPA: ATP-dependent zinc metalloprotease FtsH [Ktedonobacteraceae bacterium]|nr:ATP-dependent zinc metalloprotease FtsH [Ktedonobacteraceae bacterium]
MDDKGVRWRKPALRRGKKQKRNVKDYQKAITKFFVENKRGVFTGVLLTAITVLLFGIFSLLPAPGTTSTPPVGVTVVNYSTFIHQVEAGNVQAVRIQGQEINALLIKPYHPTRTGQASATPVATSSPSQQAANFAAWSHYLGAGYPNWPATTTETPVNPENALYTTLPASGDNQLMPLLISKHVTVATLPAAQSPAWLGLLWKFLPILVLILLMAMILAPRNGRANAPHSSRAVDDRINQMVKGRARRYDGAAREKGEARSSKEVKPPAKSATAPVTRGNVTPANLLPPVTFADVAGIDEVRIELEEIVRFLRDPQQYERLGARIPRGALLVGPPGTGKTLMAKAVAGEAGVPFFSMSASEFVEMFVGIGASRVRDLFQQARQAAPCVIFIDELDAVGRKRSMRISGNDERDQTLNQLLVELDGFNSRAAVVVLAATNRVDILDTALLRPGRFDRHITVSYPDRAGREAILKVHTRKTPLHADVSLERLSRMTTGMSGADLANLVNEAALLAARNNLESLNHDCFEQALARVQLGALRPLVMSEQDRRVIAYHEGGHALVAYHLPEADTVNAVTILPRGQSLGVTQFIPEEDRYNYSREFLMSRIAVGLGGRVAEELTFGAQRVTTGAENDLQVVTDLARRMVTRWGMSEQVGVIFADYRANADGMGLNMSRTDLDLEPRSRSLVIDASGQFRLNGGELPAQRPLMMSMAAPASSGSSIPLNALIDREVQRILNDGRDLARNVLTEHADQLHKLASALMEHEHLKRQQFEALLAE